MHKSLSYILFIFFLLACKFSGSENPANIEVNSQYVNIGGVDQYVEINTTKKSNPILLVIHGGPAEVLDDQLKKYNLEIFKYYTVVFWHQRGTNKTYLEDQSLADLSIERLIKDGALVCEYLRETYGQSKIHLLAHSFGTIIGLKLVQRYPSYFEQYTGMAQVINMQAGYQASLTWLENEIPESDLKSIERLNELIAKENSSWVDNATNAVHLNELLIKYRGISWSAFPVKEILSKEDFLVEKGKGLSKMKLFPETVLLNLSQFSNYKIPIRFFQGRNDWLVPSTLVEEYVKKLDSDLVSLHWFENSGHNPYFEEAAAFNQLMKAGVKK